ncbi:hypothetical protein [Burkholderia ubonensis]|uniref:hypothetical protein n=1 Tax=Burkholderia ubonensis TaxID=101571 RepID=UPI000A4F2CAF|nr:hypothetical protein [Burkholderia ubonensis]
MTFDKWATEVARELTDLGMPLLEARHVPYDNEDWFRHQFEAGENASMAAYEWFNGK